MNFHIQEKADNRVSIHGIKTDDFQALLSIVTFYQMVGRINIELCMFQVERILI